MYLGILKRALALLLAAQVHHASAFTAGTHPRGVAKASALLRGRSAAFISTAAGAPTGRAFAVTPRKATSAASDNGGSPKRSKLKRLVDKIKTVRLRNLVCARGFLLLLGVYMDLCASSYMFPRAGGRVHRSRGRCSHGRQGHAHDLLVGLPRELCGRCRNRLQD